MPTTTGRHSTLDLLGPGFTLFTGPQRVIWETAAACFPGSVPLAGWLPPGVDAERPLRETVESSFAIAGGSHAPVAPKVREVA